MSFNNVTKFRNATSLRPNLDKNVIADILPIINFIFIIFGTFGNLLTFSILIRKNVRKHSYMRYLASLCVIDTLCLYTWNFSMVYNFFRNKKVEHEGPMYCRIFSFFSYFILQSSSWVICSIGMDRIITVIFRNKANMISKLSKHTLTVIFSVLAIFFCFNFTVLINNAQPLKPNSTETRTYTCYEPSSFFVIWDVVHIAMYSLLPFCIIFIENISLSLLTLRHTKKMSLHCKSMSYPVRPIVAIPENKIKLSLKDRIVQKFDKKKRVYRKSVNIQTISNASTSNISTSNKALEISTKRSRKMQAKGFHVANLLLFLTVSFFFTTVPYSTFYALKLNASLTGKAKNIVVGVLTMLQYMRHSANFLIYLFTSSIIKNEINVIFLNFKRTCCRQKLY